MSIKGKNRIIIVAPSYSPQIGGSIVLHKLCDILNELKYDAYLTTTQKLNGNTDYFILNPTFNTKIATEIDTKKDIILYPEIERGNPFQAKHVIRYILSKSHLVEIEGGSHSSTWGDKDFWLYFHNLFYDGIKEKNILHLIHSKVDSYVDLGINRNIDACFTYRKNPSPPKLYHPQDSIEISYNTPDKELINIFNQCKRFYSYDTETYLSVLAALCGCESVIIPQKEKNKQEIINNQPTFKYGIAYGIDDIKHANNTQPLVREHLNFLETKQTQDTLKIFNKILLHFNI